MAICELNAIKIDLKTESYISDRKCKQNDTLILNFTILDYSVAANLTGYKCVLKVNKADKGYEIRDTDITQTDNKVKIKCPSSVTQFAGDLNLEVCFIDTINNLQKTSFDICIEVRKSVLGNSDGTLPPVIFTQLQQLDEIIAKVESSISKAEQTNNTLNSTNDKATNTNTALNASINNANTAKSNCDTATGNLNNAVNAANGTINELKQANSQYTQHINNADIHVTKDEKINWNNNLQLVQDLMRIVNMFIAGAYLVDENNNNIVDENGNFIIG